MNVKFSDDFKEKTKYKKLSPRERGRLINERFENLTLDQIKKATSRIDIAKMLGYTDSHINAGVTWVARAIKEGKLKESFYGYSAEGKVENMYELPSTDPRYSKDAKTTELKAEKSDNFELLSASILVGDTTKVSVENISVENLAKLINFLK